MCKLSHFKPKAFESRRVDRPPRTALHTPLHTPLRTNRFILRTSR